MREAGELVRVVAPWFVAGLIMHEGVCVHAAPILRRWCYGKDRAELRRLFARRGWRASIIPSAKED